VCFHTDYNDMANVLRCNNRMCKRAFDLINKIKVRFLFNFFRMYLVCNIGLLYIERIDAINAKERARDREGIFKLTVTPLSIIGYVRDDCKSK
jgi:hypothetical protein